MVRWAVVLILAGSYSCAAPTPVSWPTWVRAPAQCSPQHCEAVGASPALRNVSVTRLAADASARDETQKRVGRLVGDLPVRSAQAVSEALRKVYIVDRWRHPVTGTFYSRARIEVPPFLDALEPQLDPVVFRRLQARLTTTASRLTQPTTTVQPRDEAQQAKISARRVKEEDALRQARLERIAAQSDEGDGRRDGPSSLPSRSWWQEEALRDRRARPQATMQGRGAGRRLAQTVRGPTRGRRSDVDVGRWLRRPGVRLLAVEFYASWCKPCMEAVPRWRALHERYRQQGLRLVVVAVNDPQAGCVNPGWSPDDIVCDDEGFVARSMGAGDRLPAAFLWDWQGRLLVRHGHVDDVEQAVDKALVASPRVAVEVANIHRSVHIDAETLQNLVRDRLRDEDKLRVLANAAERARLDKLRAAGLAARYDEKYHCEIGMEVSPNSLLHVRISGGPRPRLQLSLLSIETGCLTANAVVDWNPNKPRVSVSAGVLEIIQKLRPRIEMP